MITWFLYIVTFSILSFVLVIAFNAIKKGLDTKNASKENILLNNDDTSGGLAKELEKITKLYNDGILNDEEFAAAKKKILS